MTGCAEILALVEKLSDLETTAAETLAAKAHLEKCPSCRSHFEFLASLAALTDESRSMPFPEPPESYWEHLPRKVLDRIDSESRRPSDFFRALLAPSILRWGALGATLLLVTTVGVTVLRNDTRKPERAPVAPAAPVVEAPQAQVAAEPIVSPPMARDEAVAAPLAVPSPVLDDNELESPPKAEERERLSADSSAPAPSAPADAVVTLRSNENAGTSLRSENVQFLESANRARPMAAGPAALSQVVLEDCEALRRTVASLAEGPGSEDARFQLARCSLESHEREATEELRTRAIEDAEAFLARASEGVRAEEVRKKLRLVKPD